MNHPILEKFVAISISDRFVAGNATNQENLIDNAIGSAIAVYSSPMLEQYSGQFLDANKRLIFEGLVTSASLFAADYLRSKQDGSYINYLKKGFAAEVLLYVYKMKMK